ncbi:MAG: hypothetical protein RBT63_04195 [Bdellovibrionales bacterium]|jgi:hypothetical protein|nr:hypothetical protein [Bdellovibrionales bacterium]
MSSNDSKNKGPRKVIDISDRLPSRNPLDKLKSLKVRLDLEQAKVAIPMSLLSIVVIVTLANSQLLTSPEVVESREMASHGTVIAPSRGIASVPTGTSQNEDLLVQEMAAKTLSEISAIGRKPSALEKLSIETLEGKYAIRMNESQKISEIAIAENQIENPIAFDAKFVESNREWMPVSFEKSVRVQNEESAAGKHQVYHLVNKFSMPVARVDVSLDGAGRLLNMKIVPTTAAQ